MNAKTIFSLGLLGLLLVFDTSAQARPGISARFGAMQVVEAQNFQVRIEVNDALHVIEKVTVFFSITGQTKQLAYTAKPGKARGDTQWWSALIPASDLPGALSTIQLRAHLMTDRGGLILSLGEPEPFEMQILSTARAKREAAVFQRLGNELQGDFPFVGGLGLEFRAATPARVPGVLSASAKAARRWEMGFKVSVGPAFLRPKALNDGGPVVLGFELSGRRRIPSKPVLGLDVFTEFYTNVDLRLPGIDPHIGLRFGASHAVAGEARIDVALGGGVTWFDLSQDERFWGFSGGLQSILWFGDTAKDVSIH